MLFVRIIIKTNFITILSTPLNTTLANMCRRILKMILFRERRILNDITASAAGLQKLKTIIIPTINIHINFNDNNEIIIDIFMSTYIRVFPYK